MTDHTQELLSLEAMARMQTGASEFSRLGDDCLFAHLDRTQRLPSLEKPVRIEGWMVVLCTGGEARLDIDLKECRLTPASVACVGLDNIIRIHPDGLRSLEACVMVMSPEFMRDLNIDLNIINIAAMAKAKSMSPMPLVLPADDAGMLRNTMELIHSHIHSSTMLHYKRSIVKNLVAAMLYHLMRIGDDLAGSDGVSGTADAVPSSRRSLYLHRFMRLVQEHHRRERAIGFYASKLFISPKYLSLLIKQSTGRSAGQWIDDMVILEAKNMLRFSGKNIQQVAYELNFSNQSAFGKYFKHLTGMSPSDYQRS